MNLNQVTVPVNNMEQAVSFYNQIGLTLIVDTPHYARFECPIGDSTLSLSLDDSPYTSNTTIYFEYEELDKWVQSLQDKGIEFLTLSADKPYLWREATLADPSGNKIKLYWAGENRKNPPWKV
ncbi:MAG: VOC family protein [Kangiellaceae bacterium]|nr:VOC family protein [Kangiellaceae bacterium]MCW8999397.1 VOC family protein [Kangiellaceae bacterium]